MCVREREMEREKKNNREIKKEKEIEREKKKWDHTILTHSML